MSVSDADYERVDGVRYRDGDGLFIWHCAKRARGEGDEFTCPYCGETITVQTDQEGLLL